MGTYQAPQVPQPAVTFGGGNYVDLSTVNMLQAQNAALQQENVALKSANQSLQQQRENPICKAAMGAPIYFTTPPCCHSGDCGYIDCCAITLRDQSLFFNCGYVVPPLNTQYEEVQPDLHSLERYDFSKMPDLLWYP